MNLTDPDSRPQKTRLGHIQGYNAQAVCNEQQIVLAAEVMNAAPDFGHLEPMLTATQDGPHAAGVTEQPGIVLADAGYWHHEQMQAAVNTGIQVLIPPDSGRRKGNRPGWEGGAMTSCAASSQPNTAKGSTGNAKR